MKTLYVLKVNTIQVSTASNKSINRSSIKKGALKAPFLFINLTKHSIYFVKLNIKVFKRDTKLAGSFKLPRSASKACSNNTSAHCEN